MNVIAVEAVIGGKKFRVQHPGNRKNLEMQQRAVNARTGSFDQAVVFDYMFEHCVIPLEGQDKPDLDWISPQEVEEWAVFLPTFLRGQDVSKWCVPRSTNDGSDEQAGVSRSAEEGGADRG